MKTCVLTNYEDDGKKYDITGGDILNYYKEVYFREVSVKSEERMKMLSKKYVEKRFE